MNGSFSGYQYAGRFFLRWEFGNVANSIRSKGIYYAISPICLAVIFGSSGENGFFFSNFTRSSEKCWGTPFRSGTDKTEINWRGKLLNDEESVDVCGSVANANENGPRNLHWMQCKATERRSRINALSLFFRWGPTAFAENPLRHCRFMTDSFTIELVTRSINN